MGEGEWRPASGTSDLWGGAPLGDLGNVRKHVEVPLEGSRGPDAPSTGLRQDNSGVQVGVSSYPSPAMIPIPGTPTLSVLLPPSPSLSVRLPPPASSFDRNCTPSQAPVVDRGRFDHLSSDQLRELRKSRGYGRRDSKVELKTRLASMDAEGSKRTLTEDGAMDTSVSVTGKRGRAPADVVDNLDGPPSGPGKAHPRGSFSRRIR